MATGMLSMACLLVATSVVPADVWPINQLTFNVPIRIDATRRQEIKTLELYASSDLGKTWKQVAVASPDKDSFPFFAPTDGVYYLSLCVIDRKGVRDPVDVAKSPPAQKVLVDTLKPLVRIVSAERQSEEIYVGWEIQEEHADLATLKMEYRTNDSPANMWYTVPVTPSLSGQTRFRSPGSGPVSIRLQVLDQATNSGSAATEIAGVPAPAPAPMLSAAPAPALNPAAAGAPGPVFGAAQSTSGSYSAPPPAFPPPSSSVWEAPKQHVTHHESPAAETSTSAMPTHRAPQVSPFDSGTRLVAASDGATAGMGSDGNIRLAHGNLPPIQIISTSQLSLDYEITKKGPSGVGKVQLWLTQDDGRSWKLYAEDEDLYPPITVDLPGEGTYGFSLVVQSRAGLGKRAPLPGDPPEMRVEVDLTSPRIELYRPEADPRYPNKLFISWKVTDKNLASAPITLQWAEKPNGSWSTIGADLSNTGRHAWQLPPNLPERVYLRLLARDIGGNVEKAETPAPVLVDLSEPEGRITGLSRVSLKQ